MSELSGKVKFFKTEKGFGFISGSDGQTYFVHESQVANGPLEKDDRVSFSTRPSKNGLTKAVNVNKL